jgi:hypothetical protein
MIAMKSSPATRRHRFRFSLRALLLAVTILSLCFAWCAAQREVARERQELIQRINKFSGMVVMAKNDSPHIPIVRQFFGDETIRLIVVPLGLFNEKETYIRNFPDATVTWQIPE